MPRVALKAWYEPQAKPMWQYPILRKAIDMANVVALKRLGISTT